MKQIIILLIIVLISLFIIDKFAITPNELPYDKCRDNPQSINGVPEYLQPCN